MMTFLNVFRKIGGALEVDDRGSGSGAARDAQRSLVLETDVHPGFMTDWQQPLVVALTQTKGLSIVHETVYENRLGFTARWSTWARHPAVPRVPRRSALPLRPAQLQALRGLGRSTRSARGGHPGAGPARRLQLPIAALAPRAPSTVRGIDLIYRGYEQFLDKLDAVGAGTARLTPAARSACRSPP